MFDSKGCPLTISPKLDACMHVMPTYSKKDNWEAPHQQLQYSVFMPAKHYLMERLAHAIVRHWKMNLQSSKTRHFLIMTMALQSKLLVNLLPIKFEIEHSQLWVWRFWSQFLAVCSSKDSWDHASLKKWLTRKQKDGIHMPAHDLQSILNHLSPAFYAEIGFTCLDSV